MILPLHSFEGPLFDPGFLDRVIYDEYLNFDPNKVKFSEICEKVADTLGLFSTSRLKTGLSKLDETLFCRKSGSSFAPITFEVLLNLPQESRTEGYWETAERVRCVERFIEQAVQRRGVER